MDKPIEIKDCFHEFRDYMKKQDFEGRYILKLWYQTPGEVRELLLQLFNVSKVCSEPDKQNTMDS